ncbi:MAG: hypothetical protein CFE47_11780 [Pseudomonas sp. PGPPP1]|nr:MAG: hypothetical protein CFE47_11780 [Pseudomonas sp. PGPPP1]
MAHTYRSPQTNCDNSADLAFMGDLQIEQAQQLNEALSSLTEFADQQGFGSHPRPAGENGVFSLLQCARDPPR